MMPGDIPNLTPEDIKHRRYGSKMVLLVEQCMCATIWGCKACLLIMYYRLTINLRQNLLVKLLAVYVAVTYVVMEILYFAVWCRPFHKYWAVPVLNRKPPRCCIGCSMLTCPVQCSTALHHLITNLAFNVSSDLMMLAISISLAVKLKLPIQKKIALSFLFSLGIFVILCAILSKVYSFTAPFNPIWENWYTRESSTAMIVTNVPHTWALWRRVFHLKSFNGTKDNTPTGLGGSQSLHQYVLQSTNGDKAVSEDREAIVGQKVAHYISHPSDSARPSNDYEVDEDHKLWKDLNFRMDVTPTASMSTTISAVEPVHKPGAG